VARLRLHPREQDRRIRRLVAAGDVLTKGAGRKQG